MIKYSSVKSKHVFQILSDDIFIQGSQHSSFKFVCVAKNTCASLCFIPTKISKLYSFKHAIHY